MINGDIMKKVYYYCLRRTGEIHHAEDLAGDIILEVLTMLDRGYQPSNFYAWLWTVAKKKYANWVLKKNLQPDDIDSINLQSDDNIESDIIQAEEIDLLRRELSILSKEYRNITVAYYIDNIKISDIAKTVNLPEGTVKRKLYESRKYLKEGMNMTRTYGKRSYAPENINFNINRSSPIDNVPYSLIKTKLAKNILLEAYDNYCTIEELCIALGVSAPYLEEVVDELEQGLLLKKDSKGKYTTDFIILDKDVQSRIFNRIQEITPGFFEWVEKFMELEICYNKEIANKNNTKSVFGDISDEDSKWFYLFKIIRDVIATTKFDDIGKHSKNYKGRWNIIGYEDYFHNGISNYTVGTDMDGNSNNNYYLFKFYANGNSLKPHQNESELLCDIMKHGKIVDSLSDIEKQKISQLEERNLVSVIDNKVIPKFPIMFASELNEGIPQINVTDEIKDSRLKCTEILTDLYQYILGRITIDLPEHLHEQAKYCSRDLIGLIKNSVYQYAESTGFLTKPNDDIPIGIGMYII